MSESRKIPDTKPTGTTESILESISSLIPTYQKAVVAANTLLENKALSDEDKKSIWN